MCLQSCPCCPDRQSTRAVDAVPRLAVTGEYATRAGSVGLGVTMPCSDEGLGAGQVAFASGCAAWNLATVDFSTWRKVGAILRSPCRVRLACTTRFPSTRRWARQVGAAVEVQAGGSLSPSSVHRLRASLEEHPVVGGAHRNAAGGYMVLKQGGVKCYCVHDLPLPHLGLESLRRGRRLPGWLPPLSLCQRVYQNYIRT